MLTTAMLAVMLAADPVAASAPSVKMLPQVFAEPGKPFRITCESNCKKIRWTVPSGIERLPLEWVKEPDRNLVGIAPMTGGTYKIDVLGSLADEWVEGTTLLVVGQQPVPPGPGPIPPGPTPPAPPGDALAAELQAAFAKNPDPKKYSERDFLVSIYLTGAKVARDPAADPKVTSKSQLIAKLRAASSVLLSDNDLRECRDLIRPEVEKCFGVDAPLDAENRMVAAACLERVARCLSALK